MNAYELSERKQFHQDMARSCEYTNREDKRFAVAALNACWQEYPQQFAERLGWLLNGSYGKGAYDATREIATNKRVNRVAALSQIIACLEWGVSPRDTAKLWKSLSPCLQTSLNARIQAEIDEFLAEPA